MKIFNFEKGRYGEKLSKNYLLKKGYKIIETNYSKAFAEVDIIAIKNGILTFFEVKSRKNYNFGRPFEAVNLKKIEKIRKVANIFLIENNIDYKGISFDILEVNLSTRKINHIKSCF